MFEEHFYRALLVVCCCPEEAAAVILVDIGLVQAVIEECVEFAVRLN
jgi:hypothetical protein